MKIFQRRRIGGLLLLVGLLLSAMPYLLSPGEQEFVDNYNLRSRYFSGYDKVRPGGPGPFQKGFDVEAFEAYVETQNSQDARRIQELDEKLYHGAYPVVSHSVFVYGAALIAVAGFYLMVYRTRMGKALFWLCPALLVSPFLVTWLLCLGSKPGDSCGAIVIVLFPLVYLSVIPFVASLLVEAVAYRKRRTKLLMG